ncbi:MAG: M48 family metalloprotease [Thiotrichaceae bacterium]
MNFPKCSTRWLTLSAIAFYALLTSGCSVNPVSGNKEFVMMSEQQEVSLGAGLHKQVLKQYKPYNNAALQAYVNQIGQSLSRHSHRNNIRYYFTVVDDPSINAFALPGGYIYITRGLMAYLNSEAELAGVLAHEIGHVTARHSARQQTRDTVTNVLAAVIAKQTGNAQVVRSLATASVRGFGRKHELQSDQLGAEYLARAGYDPHNMIKVIEVLKAQEDFSKFLARSEGRQPPTYHGTFATHPSNDKRLQQVVGAANSIKSARTRPDNRRGYLNRISGLKYNKTKKVTGQVRLITARSGDTFASLARRSGIPKYAEQKLRLLNGLFPKGEPRPGQLIKVVQ